MTEEKNTDLLYQKWIDLAKDDLKIVAFTLKNGPFLQGAFHVQQCVEKVLKGVIIITKSNHHPTPMTY